MLTPSFSTEQNEDFVILRIRVPHVKISDLELFVEGCLFKCYLKPYFLRLTLPGEVVEDGSEKAQYDVDAGVVIVHLPKKVKGEFFDGLDMLTTLLTPVKKHSKPVVGRSLIEVMDDECGDDSDGSFDWNVEQEPFDEEALSRLSLSGPHYGFANSSSGVFVHLQGELPGLVELSDPDSTPAQERRLQRIAMQDAKFDEEHYLYDFVNSSEIEPLLEFEPVFFRRWQEWNERQKAAQASDCGRQMTTSHAAAGGVRTCDSSRGADELTVSFTPEELDQLRKLPNKDYILDKSLRRSTYLGLVDLVLAYCYNHRTTGGENTVESGWTVSKLSNMLSFFEWFHSVSDVVLASIRNMLSYPLYRHWALVQAVLADTVKIFQLGRRQLLKCLLEIRALFLDDDSRYLLNDLFVTDYCVWLQRASHAKLQRIAHQISSLRLSRSSVGWQLKELEAAARLVQEEEEAHPSIVEEADDEDGDGGETSATEDSSDEEEEDSAVEDNACATDLAERIAVKVEEACTNAVDKTFGKFSSSAAAVNSEPSPADGGLEFCNGEMMKTDPMLQAEEDPVVKGVLDQVGKLCDHMMERSLVRAEERIDRALAKIQQRPSATPSIVRETSSCDGECLDAAEASGLSDSAMQTLDGFSLLSGDGLSEKRSKRPLIEEL